MNGKQILIMMCLLIIKCQIAKSTNPLEEDAMEIDEIWVELNVEPKAPEELLIERNIEPKEIEKLVKIVEINDESQMVATGADLIKVLPDHAAEISDWIAKYRESYMGTDCRIVKSNEPPMQPIKIEEIWVELKIEQKRIEDLTKEAEEKEEEIWNILTRKNEGQLKNYILKDDLVEVLPEKKYEINKWLNENPWSDKEKPFIIKRPRFNALMDSLIPKHTNQVKLITPVCSSNTQDLPYDSQRRKAIEVDKLWKIVELKKIVESEEISLGHTTGTHVLNVLPDHKYKIIEWMKNGGSDEVFNHKPFDITHSEFKHLIQILKLDIEQLQELNNRLKENPPTFEDVPSDYAVCN